MGQLHRIKWVHERLLKKEFPNCKDISQAFEISRRQALRDVDYLRYSLDAPVEYNRSKGGYEYTDSFSLPLYFLRDDEKDRLEYLASQYALIPGKNSMELSNLFQKITGEQKERKEHFQIHTSDFEEIITKAIAYSKKLVICYQKPSNDSEKRIIDPYRLFYRYNQSYLFAFCHERADFRFFLIERIKQLEVSQQSYSFHEDFLENYHLIATSFTRQKKYKAQIFFSLKPHLDRFTEPQWDEKNRILTFSFVNSSNLFRKLINLDTDYPGFTFRILSPQWLAEKIQHKLKTLSSHL
ncbi:MAG TPA: WYL domain-containing protein [Thermotogota bacterium]|nr:WYL domain-containing protein [Thermotogota bacterium]HRW35708.1 WYL domain-containing protein [Thermotogota bacterium]